jgi:hypothetical protein
MVNKKLSEVYLRRIKDSTQPKGLQIHDTEALMTWLREQQAQHVGKDTKPFLMLRSLPARSGVSQTIATVGPIKFQATLRRKLKVNYKADADMSEPLRYDQPLTTQN